MRKQVIILFGPPGAGKGTQAELLADKLNLYYLETSKVGEKRINSAKKGEYLIADNKKYYFEDEKKLWLEGKLWSPQFVTALMSEEIENLAEQGKSLIMAGSPRTVYEAEKILPLLEEFYEKKNIKIFLLEISPKKTIFRNSHRRICELMRHPILYSKETENLKICLLDGSKLIKREGLDDPETIRIRLDEYKNRTVPIFEIFEKEGIEIKKINGEQSVSDVFKDILKALGSRASQ